MSQQVQSQPQPQQAAGPGQSDTTTVLLEIQTAANWRTSITVENVQHDAAPGNWHPTRDGLQKVLELFVEPPPGANQSAHHQYVFKQLQILTVHPDYTNYLAYVLMHLKAHEGDVRTMFPHVDAAQIEDIRGRAGLQLKNRVKDFWNDFDHATREYVKASALAVLGDASRDVRNFVGTIVTTICKKGTLVKWPGVLMHLCRMLDSENPNDMDGAFNALAKICEDIPNELDTDQVQRPLNYLIPKFISFFVHPNKDIRKYAIATVNVFLLTMPQALLINMDKYMQNLFVLAGQDTTKEIRKRVCQAFVLLVELKFHLLQPHIELVIQFMLQASNDEDEQVSLEACEFWSTYCEIKELDIQLLRKYLETLIPILLKSMCYSPMELSTLGEDDEDDQFVPDRPEDINPRFHHRSTAGAGTLYPSSGKIAAAQHSYAMQQNDDDEDDEDLDFEDDEEDENNNASNWTLRKCAAAALDTLAHVYGAELLNFLLPKLQNALNCKGATEAEDKKVWVSRESAVLALGAIAEGCFEKLCEYLPSLIPYLINNFLTDKKPLVRSITCWTLSKYCKWIIGETANKCNGDDKVYFQPLLKGLLRTITDKNKKVQEAACSAFATLEEEARMMLVPYLPQVLSVLMFAFDHYQVKNVTILYDCLGTLSEAVMGELNKPELIQILIPPLMRKWNDLPDDSIQLLPLFECLTPIAQALGKGFFQFAEPVYVRCASIIEKNLLLQRQAAELDAQGHDHEYPDQEFIVCALDVLSGLAEGLEENIEALVAKYDQKTLGFLYECVQDLDPDVRQSAFALLGDLAKTCMGHLRPHLKSFLPICARNLNPEFYSVCNNASWAIGEICIRAGSAAIEPHVGDILMFLTPILLEGKPNMRSLLENASITVGRLAFVCARGVAPELTRLAKNWLVNLSPLRENQEKEHAFKGLALVVQVNPIAILQAEAFPDLCTAIASWQSPSEEMSMIFRQLLNSYKQSLGQSWPEWYNRCDPQVRHVLSARYQL